MAAMETLSEAIMRLTGAGYVDDFHPADRHLVCGRCEARFDPSAMTVDEIVRFEGASDPDDQAILYALDAGCGHRGLYSAAYGTAASRDDTAVLLALPNVSTVVNRAHGAVHRPSLDERLPDRSGPGSAVR